MTNSADTQYSVSGSIKDKDSGQGIPDLHVLVYDKDILKDDFLAIGVTDKSGAFSASFPASKFKNFLDRRPDLYFIVKDAGLELLSTKDDPIDNAGVNTTGVDLEVSLKGNRLRDLINPTPVSGWVGGFEESNPAFAYPNPDLSSLEIMGNMENIHKLQRQQKVVWPEFSWISPNGQRCYQMFAPDISRLGYTNEGRVYSIICPQQGFAIPRIGSLNVEVTVNGVRGWANESRKENNMAADMGVTGQIWFGPSANELPIIKDLAARFTERGLHFPFDKENAIKVSTHKKDFPKQPNFRLQHGECKEFHSPDFARHKSIAYDVANLEVQIGPIIPTGDDKVDHFNQTVLDLFNIASGDMLKEKHVLTWNVWFTAPDYVDQEEWLDHAEKWRKSIQADHGSPEGPGTDPRFFDGTPFSALEELFEEGLGKIMEMKESLS